MRTSSQRHALGGLGLAILMAWAGSSQAATSPTIGQTSATLSNFAYKVTDLNTSDGIAATASFDTSTTGGGVSLTVFDASAVNNGNVVFASGTPFTSSNATKTVSGVTASASKTGTTYNTSASYDLNSLTALIAAQPANMKTFAMTSRSAEINEFPIFVTLAAHSSIEFTGTFTSTSSVAAGSILSTSSFAKVAAAQASLTVSAYSAISIGLQDVTTPVDPLPGDGPQYVGLNTLSRTDIDALGVMVNTGSNTPLTQAFTLKFSNTSDHSVVKALAFDVTSGLDLMATPVPEPSSLTLMGLGLAGLTSMVVRTRRRRQQRG